MAEPIITRSFKLKLESGAYLHLTESENHETVELELSAPAVTLTASDFTALAGLQFKLDLLSESEVARRRAILDPAEGRVPFRREPA